MKLYRVTNKLGDWYVIAEHPTQAANKLVDALNTRDYGFSSQRSATNIELIATHSEYGFVSTENNLIL